MTVIRGECYSLKCYVLLKATQSQRADLAKYFDKQVSRIFG